MPAQLVALTGGNNILLDKPILLFGRHPECDIQLESRKVSRRHCCIAQVHEYLVVRDLGSTNGIRINGVRVLEGRLKAGDELTIGNFRYQISWDTFPPSPSRPQPRVEVADQPDQQPSVTSHPIEDEVLEACEEPVPLAEAEVYSEPVAVPARPPMVPSPPMLNEAPAFPDLAGKPPRKEDSAISFILPENLELSPASDEHLRKSSSNGSS